MKKKNFIPSITSNAESWKTSVSHFSVSKFFFNLKNEKKRNKQTVQAELSVCMCMFFLVDHETAREDEALVGGRQC